MPEELTNQLFDEGSEDELFTDEVSDSTNEESAGQESQQAESFLSIKYNGAEENLTREQAIELSQKGRNYDKIYNQLQELRNDPIRKMLEDQAKTAGLSVNEYMNRLGQFQQTSAINRIARDFKSKNPDATDEVAQQYAEQAYANQLSQMKAQETQKQSQATEARQSQARAQVEAFMKEFPDVDIQNLPQEVIDDIDGNGETLLSAYRKYENQQLRSQLAAARKNSENRQKAVSSVTENEGSGGESDPFLSGLLGK